jgi:hypothetical protein
MLSFYVKGLGDDTSFGYSNQDTMQLKNVIAHDLNEMDIWSKKWLMSFNPDKTKIMIFSNRSIQKFKFPSLPSRR